MPVILKVHLSTTFKSANAKQKDRVPPPEIQPCFTTYVAEFVDAKTAVLSHVALMSKSRFAFQGEPKSFAQMPPA